MADLLELSARIIDGQDSSERRGALGVNRVTGELSQLTDDIAFIESFCHVPVFRTRDGLVYLSFDLIGP